MPQVIAVPTECPDCGGKLWDNRESKKNPKAPDFKCRDKGCSGCHWPPKQGEVYADRVAKGNIATTVQKTVTPILAETPEYDRLTARQAPTKTVTRGDTVWLDEVFHLYAICANEAENFASEPHLKATITAFLFEQAWKLRPRSAA